MDEVAKRHIEIPEPGDKAMKHVRNVTIPRRCAEAIDPTSVGYFVFALLGLVAALTIGAKPRTRDS
jgi:hypothetical protein